MREQVIITNGCNGEVEEENIIVCKPEDVDEWEETLIGYAGDGELTTAFPLEWMKKAIKRYEEKK